MGRVTNVSSASLEGVFSVRSGAALALGLTDGEELVPSGLRLLPALSGSGLMRRTAAESYRAVPEHLAYAARALNDLGLTWGDYENVVLALGRREDLRDAVVAAWRLLDGAAGSALAVRALLVSELGL